jgi:hypothetical protein
MNTLLLGVGVFAALAVLVVVAERLWEYRRRCPRCGASGFTSILDAEKGTAAGDLFYQVRHCRRCELYRLESGSHVRTLDPGRWKEQVAEWEAEPPG